MISPKNIPQPRFQQWQCIVIDDRPATIVGSYYLSAFSALKIRTECFGWMYIVDRTATMSVDELIGHNKDVIEIISESYLLENMEVQHAC